MTGIRTIGVIGAGQMGNGIAHVCALAGFNVLLNDISAERLDAGIKTIQRNMDRQVHRQMITSEARDAAMKRLRGVTSLAEFSDVDFAIEAATEKEDIKRKIFDELCPRLRKNAMVASNTSSISITRLGSSTDRQWRQNLVGLFAQDDWLISHRLTVNAGLRYEFITTPTEKGGRMAAMPSASQAGIRVGRRVLASTHACAVQPSAMIPAGSLVRSMTYSKRKRAPRMSVTRACTRSWSSKPQGAR